MYPASSAVDMGFESSLSRSDVVVGGREVGIRERRVEVSDWMVLFRGFAGLEARGLRDGGVLVEGLGGVW
jgi:hypothetical protein